MNGLKNVFFKLIPLTLMLCLIAFGIEAIFPNTNVTYLSKESLTINNITTYYYTYDFQSYISNINLNIIRRSFNNLFDLTPFRQNVQIFRTIWEDGYQFFDLTKSIANATILVFNGVLTIINFCLTPIRILAGITLTALSICGININQQGVIINFLFTLLDNLVIPLIPGLNIG